MILTIVKVYNTAGGAMQNLRLSVNLQDHFTPSISRRQSPHTIHKDRSGLDLTRFSAYSFF